MTWLELLKWLAEYQAKSEQDEALKTLTEQVQKQQYLINLQGEYLQKFQIADIIGFALVFALLIFISIYYDRQIKKLNKKLDSALLKNPPAENRI